MIYNNEQYTYIKNILGDIISIIDSSGFVVAIYNYDAFGKVEVYNKDGVRNEDPSFIGNINPYRYRGYYYDQETNLYYLKSRYYSPELCRFLSPDDVEYLDPDCLNGLNLYVYCINDPISYCDPSGNSVIAVVASVLYLGLMDAAASVTVQAITDIVQGNEFDAINYLIAAGAGFIGGALGFINPYLGSIDQGMLSTGLSMGYEEYQGKADYDGVDYTIALIGSGVVSGLVTFGFNKIVKNANAFETARLFGDDLPTWFDCGNKVFFEMLGDLTPYYLAYSLTNSASGLFFCWNTRIRKGSCGAKKVRIIMGTSN